MIQGVLTEAGKELRGILGIMEPWNHYQNLDEFPMTEVSSSLPRLLPLSLPALCPASHPARISE